MTTEALVTLATGFVIGFIAQRSRMCFVGGIRDFILVRDTFLLKGMIAFGVTAWLGFSLIEFLFLSPDEDADALGLDLLLPIIIGSFGVGWLSIFANGCPLRQHILAAQGNLSAVLYLAGFFVGAVVFYLLVAPLIIGSA